MLEGTSTTNGMYFVYWAGTLVDHITVDEHCTEWNIVLCVLY